MNEVAACSVTDAEMAIGYTCSWPHHSTITTFSFRHVSASEVRRQLETDGLASQLSKARAGENSFASLSF